MSIVLCILILVMGVIVHKIYASCVTVIHFGFQSVFTEWFWCIMAGAIILFNFSAYSITFSPSTASLYSTVGQIT